MSKYRQSTFIIFKYRIYIRLYFKFQITNYWVLRFLKFLKKPYKHVK